MTERTAPPVKAPQCPDNHILELRGAQGQEANSSLKGQTVIQGADFFV